MRADCAAASIARSRALPIVMLDADRLPITSAPASAAWVEGGVGAQKSSQISTEKMNPARSSAAKIRSVPNGAT